MAVLDLLATLRADGYATVFGVLKWKGWKDQLETKARVKALEDLRGVDQQALDNRLKPMQDSLNRIETFLLNNPTRR